MGGETRRRDMYEGRKSAAEAGGGGETVLIDRIANLEY
jgi:hypothetical protein